MTTPTIRPTSHQDAAEILALLKTANLPTADLDETTWEHFFVAADETEIIGVVGLEPEDQFGLLRSLAVVPQHQNGGLGGRLVVHIERYSRNLGINQIGLITDSAPNYFAARGYRAVDRAQVPPPLARTRQFREICPDSAIVMLKSLS